MGSDNTLLTHDESGLNRRTYLSIITALGAPAVAGCIGEVGSTNQSEANSGGKQSKAKKGGTLYSTLESPLNSLDPAYASLLAAYTVLDRCSEKLFRVNRKLDIEGLLATNIETSDDGLTWHVSIREGVQFHPPYKRELVAEDIVFNFDRLVDPEIGSSWAMSLNTIENWSSVDDYTLKLDFKEVSSSTSAWIGWYGGTNVMSPDAIQENDDVKSHPVGTGPFKFEEWQTRDHITFSRFEDYWDGDLPHLDKIVFRPLSEAAVKVTELKEGNIHIVRETPSDYTSRLKQDDSVTVGTGESSGFRHFFLNPGDGVTKGRGPKTPTANRKIRQAINEAIDRNAMVDVIAGGYGRPGQSWFAPNSPWHVDYKPYATGANPEGAKSLIDEAGFDQPVELTIVAASDDSVMRQMGRIASDNLQNAGFKPKLELLEIGTWNQRFVGFEYDMCTNYMSALVDPDLMRSPWEFFQVTPYIEGNTYSDKALKLYKQGRKAEKFEKRKKIYDELQKLMIDDATQAILYHPTYVRTYRNTVKNYKVHPFKTNFMLKDVWLDE